MEDLVLSCLESRVEENRSIYARFLIGPFVKGSALTVGTALRRTLLSSSFPDGVQSTAITALYIQGITHEFSTIRGVRESVLELALNFQQIVLSSSTTTSVTDSKIKSSFTNLPNAFFRTRNTLHTARSARVWVKGSMAKLTPSHTWVRPAISKPLDKLRSCVRDKVRASPYQQWSKPNLHIKNVKEGGIRRVRVSCSGRNPTPALANRCTRVMAKNYSKVKLREGTTTFGCGVGFAVLPTRVRTPFYPSNGVRTREGSEAQLHPHFQPYTHGEDKRKRHKQDQIKIGYLQVQGPKIVYANDLKLPIGVEVVNPTQYIATVSTEGLLVIKFTISQNSCNQSFASPSQIAEMQKYSPFDELTAKNILKVKTNCFYRSSLKSQSTPPFFHTRALSRTLNACDRGTPLPRRHGLVTHRPDRTQFLSPSPMYLGKGKSLIRGKLKKIDEQVEALFKEKRYSRFDVHPLTDFQKTKLFLRKRNLVHDNKSFSNFFLKKNCLKYHDKGQFIFDKQRLNSFKYPARGEDYTVTFANNTSKNFVLPRASAPCARSKSFLTRLPTRVRTPFYPENFVLTREGFEANNSKRNHKICAFDTRVGRAWALPCFPHRAPKVLVKGSKRVGEGKAHAVREAQPTRFESFTRREAHVCRKHGRKPNPPFTFSMCGKLRTRKEAVCAKQIKACYNEDLSFFSSKNYVFKSDLCFRNIIPLAEANNFSLTPVLKVNFAIETDNQVVPYEEYLNSMAHQINRSVPSSPHESVRVEKDNNFSLDSQSRLKWGQKKKEGGEATRERIILEVWTNGSIHPRQAVHDASLSLMSTFSSFRSIFQAASYSVFPTPLGSPSGRANNLHTL